MTRTRVTLLGGVNEIGGNKFLLEEGDDRILLDFGTSIGARNLFFDEFLQPRTNSVLRDLFRLHLLPDVDGIYRDDFLTLARSATDRDLPESAEVHRRANGGRAFVDGVLLTHAHVDHFQDLAFVDPDIPVYCTPTTHRLLRAIEDVKSASVDGEFSRVRRRSVGETTDGAAFGAGHPKVVTTDAERIVREVEDGATFDVGAFRVTTIPVDHSVPGACAFLVQTPSGKRILYSGDIRFHGKLMDRTSAFLKAMDGLEPDLFLCEGTRMGSAQRDDEDGVERGVTRLVEETEGLVVTEFGWKDTTRFDTLQRVAERAERTLLVDPRLAYLLRAVDDRMDVPSRRVEAYPNVRVYVRRRDSLLDSPADYASHEAGYLARGSSADVKRARKEGDETLLAEALHHYRNGVRAQDVARAPERFMVHLSFWSVTELFDLDPAAGSRWVRCATEPYSDEMAMDLRKQARWLDHFGMAHSLNDSASADDGALAPTVHVSGHASGEDIARLVRSAAPRVLAPVHTQERSLDLFEDLGFDARLFRGATYRDSAKGACVIEL